MSLPSFDSSRPNYPPAQLIPVEPIRLALERHAAALNASRQAADQVRRLQAAEQDARARDAQLLADALSEGKGEARPRPAPPGRVAAAARRGPRPR